MFGQAWSPMSVPDLAPDDDDDTPLTQYLKTGVSCSATLSVRFFLIAWKYLKSHSIPGKEVFKLGFY